MPNARNSFATTRLRMKSSTTRPIPRIAGARLCDERPIDRNRLCLFARRRRRHDWSLDFIAQSRSWPRTAGLGLVLSDWAGDYGSISLLPDRRAWANRFGIFLRR